jgi:hypothetical protein
VAVHILGLIVDLIALAAPKFLLRLSFNRLYLKHAKQFPMTKGNPSTGIVNLFVFSNKNIHYMMLGIKRFFV